MLSFRRMFPKPEPGQRLLLVVRILDDADKTYSAAYSPLDGTDKLTHDDIENTVDTLRYLADAIESRANMDVELEALLGDHSEDV